MRKSGIILLFSVMILSACNSKPVMPVFTLDAFPVIDGSTVTIPMDEALKAKLSGKTLEEARPYVSHSQTHQAYVKLINGTADLILVTSPSAAEKALAESAGVKLEIVPIVSEGFVFLTNVQNPVDSLTLAQLVDLYSGKITNWRSLGGHDAPIIAFQRPVNSGSQTGFLDLIMKDTIPMKAPSTWIYAGMGELVDAVANYDNAPDAIGYSYYYFVTDMWGNDRVKLLKVNGIYPTKTTIANKSYPIRTAYYAVFNHDQPSDGAVRKIVSWILSTEGQRLMEDSGYVKIK